MHPGYRIDTVHLCREPVDFRKQINGLAALVEGGLGLPPFTDGHLFAFTNRRHDRIKILYWDRNGFCLWQKRLEQDRFAWPTAASAACPTIDARTLEWLLEGFDPWAKKAHQSLRYQCVA